MVPGWVLGRARATRRAGVPLVLVAACFILAFAGVGPLKTLYPYAVDGLARGALQKVGT